MLNFIKRNAKFVVVISVSFLIIAGLSTALIVTNIGSGGRGRNRDRDPERIAYSQEQRAERAEVRGAYVANDQTERGSRRNKSECRPLTDEQIAERTEKIIEKLDRKLADGEITQAQYDEKLEIIENGEYPFFERGSKNKTDKTPNSNKSEEA